jgi:hypothetical protein
VSPEQVFTVEAPGLTCGQVAAILERAVADGVHEIPERTGDRSRVVVGPLQGRMQGRAFAGSISAWRGGSSAMWWYPGMTNPELELEGTLRETDDGAELRLVLRAASIRPAVVVGLVLTVVIGVASMTADPDPAAVFVGLAAWGIAALLAGSGLLWSRERSLERSTDVHRFLTRILRAGAASDEGWREATWR